MPNHKKKILFWGPQCVYYWVKVFIVPAFEELNKHGWETTYFFPPLNEFLTGVPLNWKEDFKSIPYAPDLRILEDPLCSVLHINNDERAIKALQGPFSDQNPDVIVTRTHGHSYLKKLFPNAVVLTIADAIGAPWYGRGDLCFALTEDEYFYGNSLLGKHPEQALSVELSDKVATEGYRLLDTQIQLSDEHSATIKSVISDLRQRYKKLYVIPVCSGMTETDYVNYIYDHQYMSQADIIYRFLANSGEDAAIIVTSHPFTPAPDVQVNFMKVFENTERVIIADELDVDPKIFTTANIIQYCDGMICWLSKAYWHALICEKPLFDYATHDISFCKPYKDIKEWLQAKEANISREDVLKLFYWSVTRYKIRVKDTLQLHRILSNFLNRPKEKSGLNLVPDVYEWLESEEEYHAHFIECIDEIRAEREL